MEDARASCLVVVATAKALAEIERFEASLWRLIVLSMNTDERF